VAELEKQLQDALDGFQAEKNKMEEVIQSQDSRLKFQELKVEELTTVEDSYKEQQKRVEELEANFEAATAASTAAAARTALFEKENAALLDKVSALEKQLHTEHEEILVRRTAIDAALGEVERLRHEKSAVETELKRRSDSIFATAEDSNITQMLREEMMKKEEQLKESSKEFEKVVRVLETVRTKSTLDITGLRAKVVGLEEDLKAARKVMELNSDSSRAALSKQAQDITVVLKVSKVQALIRGFLARTMMRRTKQFLAARASGVLVALKSSKQGNLTEGISYYRAVVNNTCIISTILHE
jgi:ABC-type uncharacterized transport system permease subunit